MLKDNIETLKKDLATVYDILNNIEIKTQHYNAKKYSVAMDTLYDIFNRLDSIFVAVDENNDKVTIEQNSENI